MVTREGCMKKGYQEQFRNGVHIEEEEEEEEECEDLEICGCSK